ncbi:MAG: aromatic amino acid hydroxylase [Oligoflexia bacterium]|nr:aromatic amino acid hydroxylase [Oligoflexia bacterium]
MTATRVIPKHLSQYVVKQHYHLYTPIDHAAWRFIMAISRAFFKDHAHPKYLDGLKKTGINVDRIPKISEMDACLKKFGWRAVSVSGFLPPSVFLEFESLGILPIACDMRSLDHLAYTPAPDIVHEAAGHAPIIADAAYAKYLRRYGEIARKAIFSDEDMRVYEAIRTLSEVKEDPKSSSADISSAQQRLEEALARVSYVSEATLLSRMAWWTTEYGLVGPEDKPLIYGAGLLSSVGESYDAYKNRVKRIKLTVDCVEMGYDITKPQPQLFVTPDFVKLTRVLEQLADRMAYKKGGYEALETGQKAKTITTTELDSGLQISGVIDSFMVNSDKKPIFIKYSGPSQLAFKETELKGHGAKAHAHGFSAPLGPVLKPKKALHELTVQDLKKLGFKGKAQGTLHFASGIELTGVFKKMVRKNGKTLVISFSTAQMTYQGHLLYKPEWGVFDLACGNKVVGVFGDAADRANFYKVVKSLRPPKRTMKTNLTQQNKELNALYLAIRTIRNSKTLKPGQIDNLRAIHDQLNEKHPVDWLARFEILEMVKCYQVDLAWETLLRSQLDQIKLLKPELTDIINRGLDLLNPELYRKTKTPRVDPRGRDYSANR